MPLLFNDLEHFNDIFLLNVLESTQIDPAFVSGSDFTRLILEPSEVRENAGPDNDAAANQPGGRIPSNKPFKNITSSDLSRLRNLKDFPYFRLTEDMFALDGRQKSFKRRLDVIYYVVDDVV